VKRRKVSRLLDSDDSSDDDTAKSSADKLPVSSEQPQVWKIDRLKASVQKPTEPKDKQQSSMEPAPQKQPKDVLKKQATEEDRSKERKEKARKDDAKQAREKHDKKLSASEAVSKPSHVEGRSHGDFSGKSFKRNDQGSSKALEKGSKNEGKSRQSYVIPKLKKSADSTPTSGAVVVDTWSDMMKRGAELEKNRSRQTTPNSTGMRRIPKIPRASLCGKADVGVLDKIEQDPGFLRWQQAQKTTMPKSDNDRSAAAAKNRDDKNARQQALSVFDGGPVQPLLHSIAVTPAVAANKTEAVTSSSVKALLPTPVKSQATTSLLSLPSSAQKKALLPTPDVSGSKSAAGAAPIPVLLRRGATAQPSRGRFGSPSSNNEEHFVPEETAGLPG